MRTFTATLPDPRHLVDISVGPIKRNLIVDSKSELRAARRKGESARAQRNTLKAQRRDLREQQLSFDEVETPTEQTPESPSDLSAMTVAELQAMCDDLGLSFRKKDRKDVLIALLEGSTSDGVEMDGDGEALSA